MVGERDVMTAGTGKGHSALLVVGGARSGKSAYAQRRAEMYLTDGFAEAVYVATAETRDDEMRDRISSHRAARSVPWRTVEVPYDLAETLTAAHPGCILLVDCLTMWLSNRMLRGDDVEAAINGLLHEVRRLAGPAIFVTNEVGHGIVPDNALARRFRDAQGRLNQDLAEACSEVVLVCVGLPLVLKAAFTASAKDG